MLFRLFLNKKFSLKLSLSNHKNWLQFLHSKFDYFSVYLYVKNLEIYKKTRLQKYGYFWTIHPNLIINLKNANLSFIEN